MTMKQILLAGVGVVLVITLMAFGITPITEPPPEIKVALYAGGGTISRCINGTENSLKKFNDLKIEEISESDVLNGKLRGYRVLILPGGTANGERDALGKAGCRAIGKFVSDGGGFVGICAGAYVPALGWKDSMKDMELINAELCDLDHWVRGTQIVECIALTKGGMHPVPFKIHFENGPIFAPGKDPYLPVYTPLAGYKTDLYAKDAPAGQMAGRDAIIASRCGRGRVILFSPHPELTPGLETMLAQAVRWAAGQSEPQTTASGPEFSWEGIFGISALK